MEKLLTENSVRQLVRQNKLLDKDQLTLPRGTILTPAARSYLTEHKVTVSQTNQSDVTISSPDKKEEQANDWLNDISMGILAIDFSHLERAATPLSMIKMELRHQLLLLIDMIGRQSQKIDRSEIERLVEGVEELTDWTPTNKPVDQFKIDKFSTDSLQLNQLRSLSLQEILDSQGRLAVTIQKFVQVQPEFLESSYGNSVVQWQMALQQAAMSALESR